ncbi:MAG: pantoate--beta-alanine ligase, partial [Ignavibacteriae bacterium]|nr:pantoate--beta-alanine ligase [Ignavibacteriota bacterium]
MKVIKEISAMQDISEFCRRTGKKIGFVPTMGFLHEGHCALMIKARDETDIVITSIFVNPAQFAPGEDFKDYPRDFLRDYHICKSCGVDYIFYPEAKDIYTKDFYTYANVNTISETLEGKYRPEHFKGVTTIVLKLFNITKPHFTYLGQKDAQQVAVIRKMMKDLNMDIKLRVCETVREENGLARSSRNTYLTKEQREEASALNKALIEAKRLVLEEEIDDSKELKKIIKKFIETNSPNSSLQYIAVTDNLILEKISNLKDYEGDVLISLAAYYGKTRLI